MKPKGPPVGRALALAAKSVSRAFNDALAAEEGGSAPAWLILDALVAGEPRTQTELARAVGIEGPTLTRHLDGLERAGLVERTPGSGDRRATRVELTDAGRALHGRLLARVIDFDRRLRAGLGPDELGAFVAVLGRLEANVSGAGAPEPR